MSAGFQKHLYCRECDRRTLHVKSNEGMNTSLILGMSCLTVLTCGLALPVMMIWAAWHGWTIGAQRYHCQRCGRAR